MVLQKLKQAAEDYLGEKVTDAVITVPAYFNDAQRQATKDAGKIAGLNVLRIINEPTAAALAYGLDKKKDETIAVYDFGGGTFDISVLEVGEGVVEVKATNGDTHLGGDDLDDRIIEWLAAEFKKTDGIDLAKDRMALQRLKEGAEKAKIELSTAIETEINLPFVTADQTGPKHLQIKLTRAKLEQLVDDLLQRTMAPVKQALADAGVDPEEDRRSRARRRLDAHAESAADRARVLRQGAAQGREPGRSRRGRRGGPGRRADGRSQGHAAARRDAAVARHRNARRRDDDADPAQHDDSDAQERDLLDRDRQPDRASKCTCCRASARWRATTARSAGSSWSGLPPAPRGVPQIEVAFDIDANGIVNVTAKDMATGKEQKITISGSSGLSKDEVDRMVKDAQSHAAEDQARRDLIDARNQADALAYQVEKTVNENREKVPVGELSKVEAAIADVRKAAQGDDLAAIKKAIDELQRASHGIAEQLYKGPGRTGSRAAGASEQGSNVKDAEVVDAEYAETEVTKRSGQAGRGSEPTRPLTSKQGGEVMTIVRWDPFRDFGFHDARQRLDAAGRHLPERRSRARAEGGAAGHDARRHRHHSRQRHADDQGREEVRERRQGRAVPPHRAALRHVQPVVLAAADRRPGQVAAEYKNGVLTVRLPLREEAKPRQIKVDVAA